MTPDNDNARLLSRQVAAAYCGCSPSTFSAWVACGHMPAPLFGSKRWDRKAIDLALDKASGLDQGSDATETPYQKWKRESARSA